MRRQQNNQQGIEVALHGSAHAADCAGYHTRRYNYACTCAQALTCGAIPGHEVAAAQQQITGTLAGLLSLGTATKEQCAGDADFSGVRDQPWFVALVQ